MPSLALALKCRSLARIAATLVETYLGRDAGRRVLGGRIMRGVAERIGAVLWYSDLRGYTRISDSSSPDQIIPLLNDYAEAVISSIHDAGGDVLKLIGDGVLAIFAAADPATACSCALTAEAHARERVAAVNQRRTEAGLAVTEAYLGLHIGEVFYGNIGSEDRLDFTVVGPAVNEVSRIASMCRSVDRDVLLSSAFAAAATAERSSPPGLGRPLRAARRGAAAGTLHVGVRRTGVSFVGSAPHGPDQEFAIAGGPEQRAGDDAAHHPAGQPFEPCADLGANRIVQCRIAHDATLADRAPCPPRIAA